MSDTKPALPEPVPPNAEGSTTCIVRWMVTTRDGLWLGAWDKEAFAAYTQFAIDAAVAQYEQGADVEARLGDEARAEVKRLRAADVIEGYKTGLAGGPMGFVSAAFDCGWLTGAHERAALSEQPSPIDMVLHCPVCGVQHIDAPEFNGTREDKFPAFGEDPAMSWTNPPHRSHLCHGCGHIWRPADVATNGVAAIKTRGKNDSPMGACAHPVAHPAPVERVPSVEMSPEFTDTARDALLWVLWHHQGGSSPVGQPIRFALGMGAHDRLSEHQIGRAKRWSSITKSTTASFHRPAPVERVALSDTKPLDDPRLQQLFGDAIEGALAFGYQGENAAPPGHWLERFWRLGRAEAEKTLAATPPPMPARLNDQRIVELMRPLADDALIRPHVIAAARAVIAEYERINGITPAQGKETQG